MKSNFDLQWLVNSFIAEERRGQSSVKLKQSRTAVQFLSLLCALSLLLPSLAGITRAQETSASPQPAATFSVNKPEFHQGLLDLSNAFTVMCVAAHPDDEDGTTLTVLRRKYGVHTVSLFTTYGEGGQNAVGPELYEELGVIRAFETIKASQIQGSEPYFIGMKDFGFSKSAEEAFKVWGHDEVLRRMVLKIREFLPDVIITNHDTSRGHGHHQATGQLIIEAFDAAADSKRFPEQLAQLKPWQPQRLFVRIFGAGSPDNKTSDLQKIVSIDPNETDPVRGTTFAQQALLALQQHATQGPWPNTIEELLRARGGQGGKLPLIRYRLVREAPNAAPLPQSVQTLYDGLNLQPATAPRFKAPELNGRTLTEFTDQPQLVLDALIKWRVEDSSAAFFTDEPHRARLYEGRLDNALALASGVSLSLNSASQVLISNRPAKLAINLTNSGSKPLQISKLSFTSWDKDSVIDAPEHLLGDTDTTLEAETKTPATTPVSVPKAEHLYDGLLFGIPFKAGAEIDIEGAKFHVSAEKHLDVVPEVEIKDVAPSPCVRTEESLGHCNQFELSLTNHLDTTFSGSIKITDEVGRVRTNRKLVLGPRESRLEKIIESTGLRSPKALSELRKSASLKISIEAQNSTVPVAARNVAVVYSNARVAPDLRVGYVPSFDKTLERSLASLAVEAKALTVEDVQNNDLSTYDAIIIDNRGYEADPGLVAANPRLLEYVQKGGTLIVFYHKDNEWNPDPNKNRPQLAPYPIMLGGERVTDETAPIRFLQPRHLLLNYPNRINASDFDNWVQERGLYYPTKWDDHYTPLFSTNDPKEASLLGGFLVARYGEGNYIYTSMVWYRQLRAGVPGAYRMLANMISYRKAQQRSFELRRR